MTNDCRGLSECNTKTCLEQDRCLRIMGFIGGAIKKQKAKTLKELPQCNKSNCKRKSACDILGQCIFEHPKVKGNKRAIHEIKIAKHDYHVIAAIEKLMPSLRKIGRRLSDHK